MTSSEERKLNRKGFEIIRRDFGVQFRPIAVSAVNSVHQLQFFAEESCLIVVCHIQLRIDGDRLLAISFEKSPESLSLLRQIDRESSTQRS
jgi:hypothetical protein